MKTVLFARTHNAGRSQMAAAFFNALADSNKVVVLTAYDSIRSAVGAIKLGAFDYLRNPSSLSGRERRALLREVEQLRAKLEAELRP